VLLAYGPQRMRGNRERRERGQGAKEVDHAKLLRLSGDDQFVEELDARSVRLRRRAPAASA
jgi:hypothetical protein